MRHKNHGRTQSVAACVAREVDASAPWDTMVLPVARYGRLYEGLRRVLDGEEQQGRGMLWLAFLLIAA